MFGMFKAKKVKADGRPKLKVVAGISEEELTARFLSAPGSPLYLAVLAVIDEQTLNAVNDCLEETTPDTVLRHRTGGAAALTALKAELEERCQRAREMAEEKEKGSLTADKTG